MSLPALCKTISSTFSHNLPLAKTDQDRFDYAARSLEHVADKLFPKLEQLRGQAGEGGGEYKRSLEAVLELLAMIGIPLVRSCPDYKTGVDLLDKQIGKTHDAQVRRKLVSYCNQLKQRWNQAEPGGILHAPRAKRRIQPANGQGTKYALALLLLFVGAVLFIPQLNLTSAIFPTWAQQHNPAPSISDGGATTPAETAPPAMSVPASGLTEPTPVKSGDYIRYTDEHKVIHLVNDEAKVPAQYRGSMVVLAPGDAGPASSGGDRITPVRCSGNQVLVPVTLNYRGRAVQTTLLLDTGASTTTINETVASRLGINQSDLHPGTTTVADGRKITTFAFTADSLEVGKQSLPGAAISILPGGSGNGSEGLLGMNFLKEFRYHVDFKRGIIEWGS